MQENRGNKEKIYAVTERQMKEIAEYASKKGIEAYNKEHRREKETKIERTKERLEEYRRVKKALMEETGYTSQEIADIRFQMIKDLMEDIEGRESETEKQIKKEEQKKREAIYYISQMDHAIRMYREEADASRNEEEKRRFREIENIYIKHNMTVREVAEMENVSEKTVYKDLKIAYAILSSYMVCF